MAIISSAISPFLTFPLRTESVPVAKSFFIFFAIAGPDINASRQPFCPQPHKGPLGSTMVWPISPQRFVAPCIKLPSIITVLPTPFATFM